MSTKITVTAPANIAFVKYWGARDLDRGLPFNPSISMTLRECASRTTVEFLPGARGDDEILVQDASGNLAEPKARFRERVHQHLDLLRSRAEKEGRFRFATRNGFPSAAGLASSASGSSSASMLSSRGLKTSNANRPPGARWARTRAMQASWSSTV